MLKKGFSLLSLFILLVSAGCVSKPNTIVNTGSKDAGSSSLPTYSSSTVQSGSPDRIYDLMGKVKTIRGNRLTVFKVNSAIANLTKEERAKFQAEMQALSPEERAKRRAELIKVTDETVSLVIPVGTSIIKNQKYGEEVETSQLEIGDIKEGDHLKLWLEKQLTQGDSPVEYVEVVQGN